jgi:hypothetical protein
VTATAPAPGPTRLEQPRQLAGGSATGPRPSRDRPMPWWVLLAMAAVVAGGLYLSAPRTWG